MKIVDACYILGELDLLEIRLNILDKYVDKFVIVEATETFSGVPKPLNFDPVRFAKWKDKIIYYVVDDYPEDEKIFEMAVDSPNTGDKEEKWLREFYQKESLQKALVGLDDEDLVFISDVDEVWSPSILPLIGDEIYRPVQLSYMNFLNARTDAPHDCWTGTIATRYKNIKDACINHLRTAKTTPSTFIKDGGWHFCTLGGREAKMKAWESPGYDTFSDEVKERREKGLRVDEKDLPTYILENKDKWKHLLK